MKTLHKSERILSNSSKKKFVDLTINLSTPKSANQPLKMNKNLLDKEYNRVSYDKSNSENVYRNLLYVENGRINGSFTNSM